MYGRVYIDTITLQRWVERAARHSAGCSSSAEGLREGITSETLRAHCQATLQCECLFHLLSLGFCRPFWDRSLAVLLFGDVSHPSKATKLKTNYCRLFCRPAGVSRKRSHAQRCKVHITTSVRILADEVRSFLVCAPHVVAQALWLSGLSQKTAVCETLPSMRAALTSIQWLAGKNLLWRGKKLAKVREPKAAHK